MKFSMKTTVMATAAAAMLALSAPASFANSQGVAQMETEISNTLGQLDIGHINFDALTYGQIAHISQIIDGTDSDAMKKAAIEEVINANAYAQMGAEKSGMVPSSVQLRDSVEQGAKSVGVRLDNPGNLTLSQLDQMTGVLNSNNTAATQKAALEAIVEAKDRDGVLMTHVSDFPKAGELEKIVLSDMNALGVKVEHPGKLTIEQLSQLSSIANSPDTNADKAAAANKVLAM